MSSYQGLTADGLVIARQADEVAYLQSQWQQAFGQNVVLDGRSNNGQIIAIMSERFALLGELLEAIYSASYPSGAEGTAVDNILALNGLKRLAATPSTTQNTPVQQANSAPLYGLVLYGTPGTVIPAGSLIADSANPPHVFATDAAVTIAPAQNAKQTLVLSNPPTQGQLRLRINLKDNQFEQPVSEPIDYRAQAKITRLVWDAQPTSGTFKLRFARGLDQRTTGDLPYDITADALSAAVNTLLSPDGASVAGSAGAGYTLNWLGDTAWIVRAASAQTPQPINSYQAIIASMFVNRTNYMPFSDVKVTGGPTSYLIAFGEGVPADGQPSSKAVAFDLLTVFTSTLQAGDTVTNVSISDAAQGAPAQAIASATAVQTGPSEVLAGQLSVIQSPISGWDGVTNQLDTISGRDVETDEQALLRRSQRLSAQAQGPLKAILNRVQAVTGVTQAQAFANTTNAAQQTLTFKGSPSTGTYRLSTQTATTGPIPFDGNARAVQAALRALTGFGSVIVTGNAAYGFVVDFNGANGGQAQPLMFVASNTTGVQLDVAFGRPPKSIEVVVQGGTDADVAAAIYAAAPTGIATYAAPVLRTQGTVIAGSNMLTVDSTDNLTIGLTIEGYGILPGTSIVSISGNAVMMSTKGITTYNSTPVVFSHTVALSDSNGNTALVGISRPVPLALYIRLKLITDLLNDPTDRNSGSNINAKFDPASVVTIQNELLDVVNALPVGGLIVQNGTQGLASAFRDVPGVIDFDLFFGSAPGTTNTDNIQLLPSQVAFASAFFMQVSYT